MLRSLLHKIGSRLRRRPALYLVLGPLALSLTACTASWRAPVETRGHKPPPPRTLVNRSEYRVQRGDTLYGIAWQRGVDYRLLAAWNGIRPPYRIYAGQMLRLKPPPPVRRPPAAPPTSKARPHPSPATKPAPQRPSKPPPPSTPPPPQQLVWRWPTAGRTVSGFDASDPLGKGIKIGGRIGQTIAAAESGRVVYSGSGLIGYGRLIIVKHNDNYLSAYGHNNAILVKEGDRVTKGQKIAEMGTANNGDPLLHFEIRRDGRPVDPVRLLPRR